MMTKKNDDDDVHNQADMVLFTWNSLISVKNALPEGPINIIASLAIIMWSLKGRNWTFWFVSLQFDATLIKNNKFWNFMQLSVKFCTIINDPSIKNLTINYPVELK